MFCLFSDLTGRGRSDLTGMFVPFDICSVSFSVLSVCVLDYRYFVVGRR